jgi:hypothetical protein
MRRVLALAYLIVWAHVEHGKAAALIGDPPTEKFVILIGEIESHLHPQWQRVLLPAIQKVLDELGSEGAIQRGGIYPEIQIIATTHAPLVMASMEPHFSERIDKVFNFDIREGRVEVDEIPWAKQGDTVGWLVSEAFGLKQARSREAETAIEAAEAYMRGEQGILPQDLDSKDKIHQKLTEVLPGHDPFWPRWIVTAECDG